MTAAAGFCLDAHMTFPLTPEKLAHPSVLTPELFSSHNREHGWLEGHTAPEAVVMLYHRGLAEMIAERRPTTTVRGFIADYLLLDEFDGRIALAANFGIGAPAATFVLEDLASSGATTFLSVGTCGGLQPDMQPGDIVVAADALRDEGTSYHYADASMQAEADSGLVAALQHACADDGIAVRTGTTWTTDAPYRETGIEVVRHRDAGVLTVEMEAAGVFIAGAVRGVSVASLLVVSDVVQQENWMPAFHADETVGALVRAVELALSVIQSRSVPTGTR